MGFFMEVYNESKIFAEDLRLLLLLLLLLLI